jgi:hypothetical protein
LLWNSIFSYLLKYTRYNSDVFPQILPKGRFISLPYHVSTLYVNNWGLYVKSWNIQISRTHLHSRYTDKCIFLFSHVSGTSDIFLRSFALLLMVGLCLNKCNSVSLVQFMNDHVQIEGCQNQVFSIRTCASESKFLLFWTDQYTIIVMCCCAEYFLE